MCFTIFIVVGMEFATITPVNIMAQDSAIAGLDQIDLSQYSEMNQLQILDVLNNGGTDIIDSRSGLEKQMYVDANTVSQYSANQQANRHIFDTSTSPNLSGEKELVIKKPMRFRLSQV